MYTNVGCNKYTYIFSLTTTGLGFFVGDLGAGAFSSSSSPSSVAAGLVGVLTVCLTAGLTVAADLQYVY